MSRYAVVLIGGHQYPVQENEVFEVEKDRSLFGKMTKKDQKKDQEIKLDQILLVRENGSAKIGQPFVPKASVTCELLDVVRRPKIISFKFKRRKGFKKKKGHRQTVVRLRVKSIQTG